MVIRQKFSSGNIHRRERTTVAIRRECEQEALLVGYKDYFLAHRAGCDNAHHLARHEASARCRAITGRFKLKRLSAYETGVSFIRPAARRFGGADARTVP